VNTWRVILATLVIFAAGVVTGGLIARHSQQNKTEASRRNSGPGRVAPPYSAGGIRLEFLRRAQRELILEPEQRERIDKILKESQARTVQIMEPVSAELREEVERTKSEFLAVLSPEQRRRFDELVKKQHRQHEPRRPTFYQPEGSNPISPASTPER
jgi:hypothetical protein